MSLDATTLDNAAPLPEPAATGGQAMGETHERAHAAWQAIERVLVYVGDWLNPILVKETRQALKSSQFTITFVLMLLASWIATIWAVAVIGPRVFYAAEGGTLLACYYAILSLPLIVIVPLSAFRSLTAEREDNTYDLLSITTLKPRQIISGKLGSSVAQMAVYFSVITPCLAFTYLLRGVDLPTIATLTFYIFFWSLGLSMIGILLAALTTQRFVQVFIMVAFVAFLLMMFGMSIEMGGEAASRGRYGVWGVGEEFWILTWSWATFYVSSFALAFFAAAGLITFTSENRSTPLRICMMLQQASFVGLMAYFWIKARYDEEALLTAMCIAAAYWYAMGALLTAERPGMSQRVRRGLPQSFLGRVFLSWLSPGPAMGYMFVVANVTTLALFAFFASTISIQWGLTTRARSWPGAEELQTVSIVGWGYLVAYLGIGLMAITALRRVAKVTMLACVLIQALLLLAGFGIPFAIKSMSMSLRAADYTFLQITDPFWTMYHLLDGGLVNDGNTIVFLVLGAAICVLLLNVPRVIRELRVVREAAPVRVMQDEAELHPAPESLPQNPWEA